MPNSTLTARRTYSNPVWNGYFADPFVLRAGDAWYAYGTGAPDPGTGRRFPVLRSRDFATWEYVGGALETSEGAHPGAEYWAPAVAESGGRFYLYYSCAPGDDVLAHRLRVAVSDDPAGPFRDVGRELLPGEGFTIDADPFRDPADGRWYLFYARDFLDGARAGTGLAVVPLADDLVRVSGEPRAVLPPSADWQTYARNRSLYGKVWDAWHTVEGPCVVARQGRYWCFYSGGNWQTEGYGVACVVADHPLGPWREIGEGAFVLRAAPERGILGPGHNSVAVGPDGRTDYVVYHAWDAARTARRMCLDPIQWTPDGPRCDGPTTGGGL